MKILSEHFGRATRTYNTIEDDYLVKMYKATANGIVCFILEDEDENGHILNVLITPELFYKYETDFEEYLSNNMEYTRRIKQYNPKHIQQ